MTNWIDGYVTEIEYPYLFHRSLTPQLLSFAILNRGLIAPPLDCGSVRILELGCGRGYSANLIAASNPSINYVAVDFDPNYIAGARELAAAAKTPNVTFLKADFSDLANNDDIGQFDFITLHGVYTWVSAKNRECIIRIAREKLRPGGILYVSYNAFPGWSPLIPIQRLLADTAAASPDIPIADRLREGFRLFRRLAEVGALSITTNKTVVPHMLAAEVAQDGYLVHEYLNKNWKIFNFAEVVADMEQAKLTYAASADLLDHVDAINLTKSQMAVLEEVRDPMRREALRDLIINRFFRRDVYVKGAIPEMSPSLQESWLRQRFALSARARTIYENAREAMMRAEVRVSEYEPLIAALDCGPKALREILKYKVPAEVDWTMLRRSLLILVGQGFCHPALDLEGENARKKRTDAFNLAVLRRMREGVHLPFLASPVTGAAIKLDHIGQLALIANREKIKDRARFVWKWLRQNGHKLKKGGRALVAEEKNLRKIRDRLTQFDIEIAPVLQRLRVE